MKRGRKSVAEMQLALMRERPPGRGASGHAASNSREEFALKAKGYTLHNGGPRPRNVTANSRPGVVLDDGTVIVRGAIEAEKIDWSRVRGWKELDRSTVPSGLAFGARKLR